jgi:SAM-dependent methyltransferase
MVVIVKRLLKATVNIWDPIWIFLYRLRYRERKPIPPFKNRDRIGARHISWFMHSGFIDFEVFQGFIITFAPAHLSELAILDFGAGCGRVLQYFTNISADLYASDVDPSAIQYLKKAYPFINCQINNSLPPLDFPDNSLDVVYSFSVWTHLPIESQRLWLSEMKRVLRPGGLLLISFLGFHGLKLLRESGIQNEVEWQSVSDEQLRKEGIVYKKYTVFEEGSELFSGITGSYGVTVHEPDYIQKEWSVDFEVLAIQERAFHEHQDLVVLRNT